MTRTDALFWAEIFQATLTPIVAIFGLYIAWQNHRLSSLRRLDDVFDRRLLMYRRIREDFNQIEKLLVENRVFDSEEEFVSHLAKYVGRVEATIDECRHEGRYLFGPEIAEHLDRTLKSVWEFEEISAEEVLEPFEPYLRMKK